MAGTEAVARWNPKEQMSSALQDEAAWASMENAVLHMGAPVRWTQTQNNAVHAATHLKACGDAVNSLNPGNNGGGGDPAQVISFLDAAMPHIALHLQKLSGDPTHANIFKMFTEQFDELAKITATFKQKMQQAMQQQSQQAKRLQQRQAQIMSSAQIDEFEARHKVELQNAKAQSDMARKDIKQRQQLALNDAASASSIALDAQKTQAEVALKTKKAAATSTTE